MIDFILIVIIHLLQIILYHYL